jgi:hypothetical protein
MTSQTTRNTRAAIRVTNRGDVPLTLILEPWATEYQVPPGTSRDVVETGGAPQETVELQVSGTVMTFFARTGAVMSVVANGVELP